MNLKQLAETLGLSQTTVSRALNGYPEVSDSTRRRVREAADLHGYRPNTRAKALATGRSMAIGHVIPVSNRHEIVNPIFADFLAGASEVYARSGYTVALSVVEDARIFDLYKNLASTGAVDGIVVHGPKPQDERIGLLQQVGLPFVVHGRAGEMADNYSWLDVNNEGAFHRATRFLMDLGHRRIGLVNGDERFDFAARRAAGYRTALTDGGMSVDASLCASSEMTETNGYSAARAMLALPDPPTGVVVSSLILAYGVRRAAEDAGVKLGRDLSVVAYDDDLAYFRNGGDPPVFTALRSAVRDAGQVTAQMLLDRIRAPASPLRTVLLEADLVVGASTGPAGGPVTAT